MGDLLSYKNYNGTVEYSKEDFCLFGKVIQIKSLLSYEGDSVKGISPELHRNITVYAMEHGKSLNATVEEAIGNMIGV